MSTSKRTIGVITVGRSDYGIYQPVLRAISAARGLNLNVIVAGAHLSKAAGLTICDIEADGFSIAARVPMSPRPDTAGGVVRAMGEGLKGFAHVYARLRPDLILALGDRFEMHTAVSAAVPFAIPVAHIHGGEVTEGAMDELFRHSMTKMSHLHFPATREAARRILQMGEEAWRVRCCGAPALDHLRSMRWMTRAQLEADLQMSLQPAPLIVTYHPVTLEPGEERRQIGQLLQALDRQDRPIVFTQPNADQGRRVIEREVERWLRRHSGSRSFASLGTVRYYSLMRIAAAMAGNSSSGIIEAASFRLPVVNIGLRQQGRTHGINVLDALCEAPAIASALDRALQPSFRRTLAHLKNPYGDGHAAERIVEALCDVPLDEALIRKRFHPIPQGRG